MSVDATHPRSRFAIAATWVERAEVERGSLAARFPELFAGGYVNVLRLLAVMALLALAACGQSTSREPTATAPAAPTYQDAGLAVFDGGNPGALDAPALDAVVPNNPAPVNWSDLRRKVQTADALRVAAYVIGVRVMDASSLHSNVILDRGSFAGIAKGWKGRLLDEQGNRKLDELEVIEVSQHRCVARTTANPDQLSLYKWVVLWNAQHIGAP